MVEVPGSDLFLNMSCEILCRTVMTKIRARYKLLRPRA